MVSRINHLVLSVVFCSLYYAATGGIQRFENIRKFQYDSRLLRGLKLENELKVLIISHDKTPISAASLTVNAGYFNEPNDLPGLAHLLEHMLFMGSKKYPQENEYQKFLTEHAGYANASTDDGMTNFFFSISPDNLVPALDRFVQSILEPLMNESAMKREIMAVNSEYEKDITTDCWRVNQLEKMLSNPNHQFSRFSVGNFETLDLIPKSQGISVRDRLLEFHSKWYSANLMNLVVLGKESLDELEGIVIKLFSEVKNKNVQKITYEHPYEPEQLKRKFYVVPIEDVMCLKISFSTRDVVDQYKTSPQNYISRLINHKGPGSLYSLLREKELASDVLAQLYSAVRGFSFFVINIDLIASAVDRVDEIITFVFQYIKLLRTRGIQKWIFKENKKVAKMEYLFGGRLVNVESYLEQLSSTMDNYPFEDILIADRFFDKWEPEHIENLLSDFTPDNMNVIIQSKSFDQIANETERWYGTKYKVEKIPDDLIQKWKNADLSENLHLPAPNEFIPENYSVYPYSKDEPKNPYILHESSLSRIWFKRFIKFKVIKLDVRFEIVSPVSTLDPFNRNLTELFVILIKDALNEDTYAARLANLKWNIYTTNNGIHLDISGYDEKLPVLLQKIILQMTNFHFDKRRFEISKESYIRTLKNFETIQPTEIASFYLSYILSERDWTKNDLLDATSVLEYSNLKKFVPELLSKVFIEGFIHGNCDKQKAMDIINILESSLKSSFGLSPKQLLPCREVKINDGHQLSYEVFNNYHNSSCYYVYFQCSTESALNNIIMELFLQIVDEPCFRILRTQEQLGYIVDTEIRRFGGSQGFVVMIQSEKHPLYLNSRVEEFFQTVYNILLKMTDDELEVHKSSVVTKKLKKPVHFDHETMTCWDEIVSRMYNFDRDDIEVGELQKLKKSDILNFFQEFLQETSCKRRKLSVNVISKVSNPERPTNVPDKDVRIEDVTSFKRTSSFLPLPQAYTKITQNVDENITMNTPQ